MKKNDDGEEKVKETKWMEQERANAIILTRSELVNQHTNTSHTLTSHTYIHTPAHTKFPAKNDYVSI